MVTHHISAPDIARLIKRDDRNILRPKWILDSIRKQKVLPFRTKYVYFKHQGEELIQTHHRYLFHATSTHGSDTEDESQGGTSEEGNEETIEESSLQDHSIIDVQSHPQADWIKLEPEEQKDFNLGRAEESDGDKTEEDRAEDDDQEWTQAFDMGNTKDSQIFASTLVCNPLLTMHSSLIMVTGRRYRYG